MTRVLEVPVQFDHHTFDQFADAFGEPTDERLLFDAHATKWGSPYGLVGLLAAGQWLQEQQQTKPLLTIPSDRDVAHYWARAGFFAMLRTCSSYTVRFPMYRHRGAPTCCSK